MKIGAWIHNMDGISLERQIEQAAELGLQSIRAYSLGYAQKVAPALKRMGMSLLAGMHIDAAALVQDWRSQVRLDELARYHELGISLDALCVGNELREGGDAPDQKQFTARLAFGLANVLDAYRHWLDAEGYTTPLTYAMEGIVFNREGYFNEWLWPLIDACDIVGLNAYPMDNRAWFTFGAFEESRRFLHDARTRNDRLALFELRLRRTLQQLDRVDKPLILTETGFPSAVGYRTEADTLIVPENDNARYGEVMEEFFALIRQINADYEGRIKSAYVYEWRDNLHHHKISNIEQSPIHVAFGLCDRMGVPKFNIREMITSQ